MGPNRSDFSFLQVQSGWRIEYCAASENKTHCPEEFDEFYKQRRRWVASTLANMMLLMKEWATVRKFNHRVSIFFLLYQAVLLFATLIGPSSVILVVCGKHISSEGKFTFEHRHEKTCFWPMWTTNAQISLRVRAVISAFVVRCLDSLIPLLAIAKMSRL